MKKIILFTFLFLSYNSIFAQFGLPDDPICPGEGFNLTSPADNSLVHEWDFCTGDLLNPPVASIASSFIDGGAFIPEGIKLVFDNITNEWFGFITNRGNSEIIRADFGTSLDNVPTYTNLGNIGNQLNSPVQIRFVKESSNWYAFIINDVGASLTIIKFGNQLNSEPIETHTITGFSFPQALTVLKDGDSFKAVTIDYPNIGGNFVTKLSIFDFNLTISDYSYTLTEHVLPLSTSFGGKSIEFAKFDGDWYALTIGGNALRPINFLSFGNSLLNFPTVTNDLIPSFDFNNCQDIIMFRDGKNYIAYTINTRGKVFRINLGEDLSSLSSSLVAEDLGNFSLIGQDATGNLPSIAFDMAKSESTFYAFNINRSIFLNDSDEPNELIRLKFPNNCNALTEVSTEVNPENIRYILSGSQTINLKTFDEYGNPLDVYTDDIEVLDGTVGNFQVQNQCLGEETQLQNLSLGSDADVSTWTWTVFDTDGTSVLQTSNTKDFSFNFPEVGEYQINLQVENISGCVNDTTRIVGISNTPVADFEIESIDCDNFTVNLKDISTTSTFGINKRVWTFGDDTRWIASPFDATEYTKVYATVDNFNITLTVSDTIRGCSSSITKTITFRDEDKPQTNFSWEGECAGAPINFTDTSTLPVGVKGEINTWTWDFAGLGTSDEQNPSFTFANADNYVVTLTVYNSQGCSSSITQNVVVKESLNSIFVASATEGILPLTVQFQTNNLDATNYLWNFGDGTRSTEANPSHTYTQVGFYTVEFQAIGDNGCGTLVTTNIDVVESPLSNENTILQQIKIYPNPVQDILHIKLPDNVDINKVKIQISDMSGKTYFVSDTFKETLDISRLSSGLYLIKIRFKDEEITKKIVKMP